MIKRSVNQEDITILNVWLPNNRASECKKAKIDKKEIDLQSYLEILILHF